MAFTVEFGIMAQAVLNCAPDDDLGNDLAVGLGDNLSIDGPRLVIGRGAVVFGSFSNCLDLAGGKPFMEHLVPADDTSGDKMVRFPVFAQAGVVESRCRIDKGRIDVVIPAELHRLADHGVGVIPAMAGVESVVSRDYFRLDVFFEIFRNHYLCWQIVEYLCQVTNFAGPIKESCNMNHFKFATVAFLAATVNLYSQDCESYLRIVKELSSEQFQGRGYSGDGVRKAGEFIADEFARAGADEVARQPYCIDINTFPGEMEMSVDGRALTAGREFVLREYSPGVKGEYKLFYIDTLGYDSSKLFAELAKPANNGVMVVCDFWFTYKHKEDFNRLQKRGGANNAGLILKWDTPLKFYKAYGERVADKPTIWVSADFPNDAASVRVNIENKFLKAYESSNIVAKVNGRRHDSCYVFTAHYDHLGKLGAGLYFPGANDNASGVAGIITLAAHYAENTPEFDCWFVAFSGEEANLRGSTWFAKNPLFKLSSVKYLFNLDMIGDNNPVQYCEISPEGEAGFAKMVSINDREHLFEALHKGELAANSDHYPYAERHVPCILFENENGDNFINYHTAEDDMSHFEAGTYPKIFRLITDYIGSQDSELDNSALLEDYDCFIRSYETIHPEPYKPYGGEEAFIRSVDSLRCHLSCTPGLSSVKMKDALNSFLIPLHDEHTYCGYFQYGEEEYLGLPVHFRAIPDGSLIIDGIAGDEIYLGAKLKGMNGVPVEDLLLKVAGTASHENKFGLLKKAPQLIVYKPTILEYLNLDEASSVELELVLPDGKETSISLPFMTDAQTAATKISKSPRDSRFPSDNLSYAFADGRKETMTFRLKNVSDPEISEAFGRMLEEMKANGSSNLIVDLRDNIGGNTFYLYPALYELYGDDFLKADLGMTYGSRISEPFLKKHGLSLEKLNAGGAAYKIDDYLYEDTNVKDTQGADYIYTPENVYVVCNEGTFSAAFHALLMFRAMGAIIVGTPSSQSPNTYMEVTEFALPNSGIHCSVSNSVQKCFPDGSYNSNVLWPDFQPSYQDYLEYGFDKNAELMYCVDLAGGSLSVSVNEYVELMEIVARLSGNSIFTGDYAPAYQKDIAEWFGKYADHPCIEEFRKITEKYGTVYNAIPLLGVNIEMVNGQFRLISPKAASDRWPAKASREFLPYLTAFYFDTDFHSFFVAHDKTYRKAVGSFNKYILGKFDLEWFHKNFGVDSGTKFEIMLGLNQGFGNFNVERTPKSGSNEHIAVMLYAADWQDNPCYNQMQHLETTVVHEFCHSFIKAPLEYKKKSQELLNKYAEALHKVGYGTWQEVYEETYVRASTIRYMIDHGYPENVIQDEINQQHSYYGFVWMPHLLHFYRGDYMNNIF